MAEGRYQTRFLKEGIQATQRAGCWGSISVCTEITRNRERSGVGEGGHESGAIGGRAQHQGEVLSDTK